MDGQGQHSAAERFALAEKRLLHRNDLDVDMLIPLLDMLLGGGDFSDLYFAASSSEGWQLQDRKVTGGSFSATQGVGARSVSGDRTGFAYSGDMSPRALGAAIAAAVGMSRSGRESRRGIAIDRPDSSHALYSSIDPTATADAAPKIKLLQDVDRLARATDPRIVRVSASLQMSHSVVLVAASDGALAGDMRPKVQLSLTVLAEAGGKRANGTASAGWRAGLEYFDAARVAALVAHATRIALVNLDARPAPAGVMTVVLGPGFPGVLLHEAVGHGLEGDAHRKRSSVFAGRMGTAVAAPGVTVIDDGTLPGRIGSLNSDDEGTPTRRNVLIEDGKLTGLMQDRLNARLMNDAVTGNARRQSYAHLPMPRMTNTFLAAGGHDPAEIVESVGRGIYAAGFGGGQVDITSGQFNFSATEAYLIEAGRVTAPIRGATLIGLGHEALHRISMIGNDLRLENGMCGKSGQSVSVGVGQPTVRIEDMVVGGTG
ncbi:MAG: metalloprotease TldD [Rhizomicrobium sp.]